MIHDYLNDERRQSERYTDNGEVIIRWLHDEKTPIRYKVANQSGEGLSILTSAPLNQGMTGLIEKLVPSGNTIDKAGIVVWCRIQDKKSNGNNLFYRIGLRFVQST